MRYVLRHCDQAVKCEAVLSKPQSSSNNSIPISQLPNFAEFDEEYQIRLTMVQKWHKIVNFLHQF